MIGRGGGGGGGGGGGARARAQGGGGFPLRCTKAINTYNNLYINKSVKIKTQIEQVLQSGNMT